MKEIAFVRLKGVGKMDRKKRKEVATWLREKAAQMMKEGKEYADTFRARLYGGS